MTVVVLDLETLPSEDALARQAPEDYLMKGVADNWKPETVEAHRIKRAVQWASDAPKVAALDWRLGQICAVGLKVVGSEDAGSVFTTELVHEAQMLTDVWTGLTERRNCRLAGFCIRSFDLPYLLGRSALLGVTVPRQWNCSRYDHRDVIDLADILSNYGSFSTAGWSLDRYREAFRLKAQSFGSGSEVYGWHMNGDWESIRKHLQADLAMTNELFQRVAVAYGVAA